MRINWIVERCNEILLGIKTENDPLASLSAKELGQNLSEAARHGMLPVVMESLSHVKITDTEKKKVILKWYGASEQSKKNYRKRLELMEQLALQFKNAGLDVMFMKGATTAELYPEPQLRVFSDIDYYLYGEALRGGAELENNGVETINCAHHHTRAYIDGVLLENHYDFLDRENHQSDLLLDDELKRLATEEGRRYPFKFENPEVDNAFCMSPTMNAIFLMRHMGIHFFSETIALRMLYDWALFQKKYADEVDWSLVLSLYEKSGMRDFTRMIQGIIVAKLGYEMPSSPIEFLDGKTTERIWQSITIIPDDNPYKKNDFRKHLFEGWTFLANYWKFHLVFQNESYWKLFIKYSLGHMKQMFLNNK